MVSEALNGVRLPQCGDTRADSEGQLAILTELIAQSLCDRNPSFKEVIERGGHQQVARLIEDVLRSGRPLPEKVRAVMLRTDTDIHLVASALGDCLVSAPGEPPGLLIPASLADGKSGRARLKGVLRHRAAVVGHAVPPAEASSSVRAATRLLDLASAHDGPEAGVVFVDDHLSSLVLLQDESLTHTLIARRLRPLAGLTPERCERLRPPCSPGSAAWALRRWRRRSASTRRRSATGCASWRSCSAPASGTHGPASRSRWPSAAAS